MSFDFIGIDFGTSTTFAAGGKQGLPTEILSLNPDNKSLISWIPSVIATDGTDWKFGFEATKKTPSNWKKFVSPKAEITAMTDDAIDGEVVIAITKFLGHVKAHLENSHGLDFKDVPVKFGCPASWNAIQRGVLADAATAAGFKKISLSSLREEPIAAGLGWFDDQAADLARKTYVQKTAKPGMEDPFQQSVNALVFDMGGGTLDLALLRVHREIGKAYNVSVRASESSSSAGDFADRLIADEISRIDPQLTPEEVVDQAKELKENFASLEGNFEGIAALNRIDKKLLVKILEPLIQDSIAKIYQTISLSILGKSDRRAAYMLGWRPNPNVDQKSARGDQSFKDFPISLTSVNRNEFDKDAWTTVENYVDVIILAGGMSNLSVIQEAIAKRFPNTKVIFGQDLGSSRAGQYIEDIAQRIVAEGLATATPPASFDAARPPVDIVLRWQDKSGTVHAAHLFTAFDNLYENARSYDFKFGRYSEVLFKEHSTAFLTIESREGRPMAFDIYEQELDKSTGAVVGEKLTAQEEDPVSFKFMVGPNVPFRFKAYLNGEMRITDSKGTEISVNLEWPENASDLARGKAQRIKMVRHVSMFVPPEVASPVPNTWTAAYNSGR